MICPSGRDFQPLDSDARSKLIDLRKTILGIFEFAEFSHGLGQDRPSPPPQLLGSIIKGE
jgi:hypothetical protein